MEKEIIQFKIDGEWLTKFVRQRVYYENFSFDDGIKLFQSFFKNLSYDLAFDLLSGKRKLVGINQMEIVDDDKIDDYKKYLKKSEEDKRRKKLRESFNIYGIITPTGEFLSCEFGCHSIIAYDYCMNEGWIDFKRAERESLVDYYGKTKDILYDMGFVFVNEISHKFYSKYKNLNEMPQVIQDVIYEYEMWEKENNE